MVEALLKSLACLPVMPVYGTNERPVYLDKSKAKLEEKVKPRDWAEISDEARAKYRLAIAENTTGPVPKTESTGTSKRTNDPESSDSRPKPQPTLSEAEKREVARLQKRDTEVRTHEQAHLAASGGMAAGGPSYEYETGPDGKKYAVGGEVPISSQSGTTPQERLQNAEKVYRAALAPASPSSEDRAIAAEAAADATEARAELTKAASTGPSTDNAGAAATISQVVKPAADAIWQKAIASYQRQTGSETPPTQKYAGNSGAYSTTVDVTA